MSLVHSFSTTGATASGTYALGFTPAVGNTLMVWAHLSASSNTLASMTLGSGRNFIVHDDVVDTTNSERMYCLSREVKAGDASSITFTTSAGNLFFYALEVSGVLTPESSGFEAVTLSLPGSGTSHTSSYTTANPNDFVMVGARFGGNANTISGITSGFTKLANGRAGSEVFYSDDVGAAGSKSFSWTSSSVDPRVHIYAFKSAVTDPTVTSVTSSAATEGGSNVYTVTLSGATNRTTNYPGSFTGGTATSADYDTALGNATYSNGVTFSAGNTVVPTGIASFTVTVATTQDVLDEDDETIVLTIAGVASTGASITDNDPLPSITMPVPVTVDGGDSVVLPFTIPVVSGRVQQARLVLTDGTKTGGVDYTNVITNGMLSNGVTISGGVLSIPAGVASFTITIPTMA